MSTKMNWMNLGFRSVTVTPIIMVVFIPPALLASLFSPHASPSYVASPSHLLTTLIGMNQFLKL